MLMNASLSFQDNKGATMSNVRFALCLITTALLASCMPHPEERIPPGRITLALSWDPNPAEEQVIAYHIFREDGNANRPLTTVDGLTNQAQYDAHRLRLRLNDRICFRVKAENAQGLSDLSDAACTTITPDDL